MGECAKCKVTLVILNRETKQGDMCISCELNE